MSQTVRAYLPATLTTVGQLRDRGDLPAGPAYAVTPALRAQLGEDDDEALEYEAFTRAGDASLVLLHADPAAPRRRVVIAVDATVEPEDASVEPDESGRVRLVSPVPLAAVVAIHVDGTAAEPAVAAAAAKVGADRQTGGGLALDERPEVDDELEWYDVSELARLPS